MKMVLYIQYPKRTRLHSAHTASAFQCFSLRTYSTSAVQIFGAAVVIAAGIVLATIIFTKPPEDKK
jgi:hypothetical protein